MNPESENFDSLRQLLALKRHEIPPPGYFDRLPRDIMARIKAGDTGDELGADFSWFRRLVSAFDVKPIFAGAFGTVVCALLTIGVMTSERTPAFAAATATPVGPTAGGLASSTTEVEIASSSSNSVPAGGDLFSSMPSLQATPVVSREFYPGGN
jgi:hypothetical protein